MARGELVVDVIARDRASATFDKVSSSGGKASRALGAGAKVAALGLAAGAVAAVAFGKSAVNAASSAQQSIGATETVFGRVADQIIANSNKAATAVGLSANDYREAANQIGALFANKGLKGDQLAKQTDLVVQKAADLSATFGGSAKDAVEALSSAFKGEFDPLEKYGISLKQSTINTEAETLAKKKYGQSLKDLSTAQQNAIQRQATQNLINQQSAKSQGAFAKETDTLAHQQQVLGAQFENLQVRLGTLLLPIITQVTQKFIELTGWVSENQKTVGIAIAAVAAFAASVIVVNAAVTAWSAVTRAYTAVQAALNLVLAANPIGLVVIAIAALVAAFVIAYKKSDTFRAIVQGAFRAVLAAASAVLGWLKSHWPLLLAILTGPIGLAAVAIAKNWDKIKAGARAVGSGFKAIWDGVTKWLGKAWDYISDLPGKISGAFSGIWSGLAGGLKSAINSVLHLPLTIPRVNTHIPGVGTVGGQTLIPALAKGGVTTGPTLALIGDNPGGRELVKPLGPDGSVLSPREMQMLARLIGAEIVNALNGAARTARTA